MRYFKLSDSIAKYSYKLADSVYRSDTKIKELEHLSQALCASAEKEHSNGFSKISASEASLLYDEETQIGVKNYHLSVKYNSGIYHLLADNQSYYISTTDIVSGQNLLDITILSGPVLALNLALNNVFCLHASAFMIKKTLFVFMANSGTGKSTIARYIGNKENCRRIADDILPVRINNNITGTQVEILPCFPQLKLQSDQQYSGCNISGRIILLFAQKSDTETMLEETDSFNGIKQLIKHSVATRLYSSAELQNHLQFCHQLANQLKAYSVSYQHNAESPHQLFGLLNELA